MGSKLTLWRYAKGHWSLEQSEELKQQWENPESPALFS